MESKKYICAKCSCDKYKSGEIRTTGGFWTKIFNIQNKKFVTISCRDCGHTDFYAKDGARTAENILDLFTN